MTEPDETGGTATALVASGGQTTDASPVDDVGALGNDPGGDEAETFPRAHDEGTFSREYVEELRAEAAANRVKASKADQTAERLYSAAAQLATAGILHSPHDLPDGDYLDEDGYPDVSRMREAAIRVADEQPYLARVRGDVSQGVRQRDEAEVGLGDMLRRAAR